MIAPAPIASRAIHPRPIYRVEVDGTDITATLQGRLINLAITDNRGFEADQVDIEIDDTDGRVDLPNRGANARIWLGWQSTGLLYKGSYVVDEVEHAGAPDTLTVRARSADLRAGLTTQRERSWHAVTVGDIVNTLADENGLEAAIDGALSAQPIAHLDQTNESAVNLLTRLAGQFDAIATVKDGRLLFMRAAGGRTVSGTTLPFVTITRADGDRHRFSLADRHAYSGVRATYHDIQAATKGEVIFGDEEDASETSTGTKTPTTTADTSTYKKLTTIYPSRTAARQAVRREWSRLQSNKTARGNYTGVKADWNDRNLGTTGQEAYGKSEEGGRTDTEPLEDELVIERSADNVKTLRHVYASKTNALRAARTEWRRIQRGMATFSITLALGRADLYPDIPATVSGWKRAIDNTDWIITRVVHTLNESGYTTTLDLEIKATEVD